MNFNANDAGYVPWVAGHYIENTGSDGDVVFLDTFKGDRFVAISLHQWIRRLPPLLASEQPNLDARAIRKIPDRRPEIIAR